jgi:hypothetical protein
MALGCPGGDGLICRAWTIRIVYIISGGDFIEGYMLCPL